MAPCFAFLDRTYACACLYVTSRNRNSEQLPVGCTHRSYCCACASSVQIVNDSALPELRIDISFARPRWRHEIQYSAKSYSALNHSDYSPLGTLSTANTLLHAVNESIAVSWLVSQSSSLAATQGSSRVCLLHRILCCNQQPFYSDTPCSPSSIVLSLRGRCSFDQRSVDCVARLVTNLYVEPPTSFRSEYGSVVSLSLTSQMRVALHRDLRTLRIYKGGAYQSPGNQPVKAPTASWFGNSMSSSILTIKSHDCTIRKAVPLATSTDRAIAVVR